MQYKKVYTHGVRWTGRTLIHWVDGVKRYDDIMEEFDTISWVPVKRHCDIKKDDKKRSCHRCK